MGSFITLSHPYKYMRENQKTGRGKEPPSLGSGGPSSSAVGLSVSVPESRAMEFEQRSRESTKAYAAFRTYLDMGPQRSLALAAKKLGKSKQLLERWSRRHDWQGRLAAHGAYAAQAEREIIEGLARERAIVWANVWEEQRISEWKARCRASNLAERMMDRWEKNENRVGTLEGIARLLEIASKLGRQASGMASGEADASGKDENPVRIEVTLALEKIYGAAAPPAAMVEAEVIEEQKKEEGKEESA